MGEGKGAGREIRVYLRPVHSLLRGYGSQPAEKTNGESNKRTFSTLAIGMGSHLSAGTIVQPIKEE